jgi:hypothetical protein
MSDFTSRVDSGCYRGHHLEQRVRSLETLRRVFLKEFLQKNNNRLWNVFEPLKRASFASSPPERLIRLSSVSPSTNSMA